MNDRPQTSRIGRPPKAWDGPPTPQRSDQYRYIYLTHGQVALVDLALFDWLSQWTWTAMLAKSGWYAVRGGAGKHVRMHRLIMGEPSALVDHVDRNGLNNTRENLRVCSNGQNMRNSGLRTSNTSGFKGVVFNKKQGKWNARLMVNYKHVHLGSFDSAEEAARAYDAGAITYHGDFAVTNADLLGRAP